jgi:hypothetical protein
MRRQVWEIDNGEDSIISEVRDHAPSRVLCLALNENMMVSGGYDNRLLVHMYS